MKCLRCQAEMKTFKNKNVEVDVCASGCGGVWFDGRELKKMDESHEVEDSFVKSLSQTKVTKVEVKDQRLNCPKCKNIVLMRRFYSPSRSVELDECAGCGGLWFDAGEYTHILKEYPTEESRKKAAQSFVDDVFGQKFEKLIADQQERKEKIEKISLALEAITPSKWFD